MTRHPIVPRRKVFFVACEGKSEQGYVALLQKFADSDDELHIHILAKVMDTYGDPMQLVNKAVLTIGSIERDKKESSSKGRFLLLDTDQLTNANHKKEAQRIAEKDELILIWQDTCFESVLLRHFKDHENDDPPTSEEALKCLEKVWPKYKKGMAAMDLKKRITLADVCRAAKSPLNPDLAILLEALGLAR